MKNRTEPIKRLTQKEAMKNQISDLQRKIRKQDSEIELLSRRINYLEEIIIEMKKNQVASDLSKILK